MCLSTVVYFFKKIRGPKIHTQSLPHTCLPGLTLGIKKPPLDRAQAQRSGSAQAARVGFCYYSVTNSYDHGGAEDHTKKS